MKFFFSWFVEGRWKTPGLMFSSVEKGPKIVLHLMIPPLGEYLVFQSIAMKKWYSKFSSLSCLIKCSFLFKFSWSQQYKVHWYHHYLCIVSALCFNSNYCFVLELQFMKVFSSFKDVKVIHFSSVQDAFTGFADKARPFCCFCFKCT